MRNAISATYRSDSLIQVLITTSRSFCVLIGSDCTVVDGEVVALDDSGKPNFNLLQNFRSAASHIHYFIFDLLTFNDCDLMGLSLNKRRELLKSLKLNSARIRIAEQFEAKGTDMLATVKQQGLEGIIAKRKDSLYEAGKRTGSWVKCRVNKGQELVIGGYIPGPHGFDSLIVGYYRGKELIYVARFRNGFVVASRRQVFEKIRHLASPIMPFANLPDNHKSRWGDELTAEKMKGRVWLLCRVRHNNHHVGCRTMPHAFGDQDRRTLLLRVLYECALIAIRHSPSC